jgi:hypothetical protein
MRQSLIALRMAVRQGFLAVFGMNIRPGDFSGEESLFWLLAALQVLVYGALSLIFNLNETFSFYFNYNSFFACLLMVTILPLIGFLSRRLFWVEQTSYLLPVIFLSIHIPVLLIEGLVWSWGRHVWPDFSNHLALWETTINFILFILVYRAFLMNERSTTSREQFRLMLTAIAFIAVFTIIPDKSYFRPYYMAATYIHDDSNDMTDEELFSAQPALLQSRYKTLKPSQHGKADFFVLTYGGDGYQQVFRREALFAQQQIDRALGSAGRSVTLANSEKSRKTIPLANLTNLSSVTGEMARRAQTGEDILVLYITSHGGQNGEISTDLVDTELMDVDARKVGKVLKESGFRWKVIIVSACYSGSFIPVMKDDDTLIITAASATRTSFGCADDADLTYFGEAFLKDSLPKATGFEDAFTKTRKIIADREKAENITPSDPQISMGKNIRAKLARMKFNAN